MQLGLQQIFFYDSLLQGIYVISKLFNDYESFEKSLLGGHSSDIIYGTFCMEIRTATTKECHKNGCFLFTFAQNHILDTTKIVSIAKHLPN